MRPHQLRAAALVVLSSSGCLTGLHSVRVQDPPPQGEPFVTAGPAPAGHESLGIVQVLRSGPLFVGFVDPAGTNLEWGFAELKRVAIERGADGVARVTFRQTDYPWWARLTLAIAFFVPVPTEVIVRGELVKRSAAPVLPVVTLREATDQPGPVAAPSM